MVCKHLQDETYQYNDLCKPQHVLELLIVCEHLQDKTDKYNDLYEPQTCS